MFSGCTNLKYVNFTTNNLSSIEDISNLFYNCKSLESIDLSNRDFSKVKYISSMFDGCNNLKYVNFSNINLSSVENISYLFYNCKSLESIDLYNLDISKVKNIKFMFLFSLKFLNLSNTNASSIVDMHDLFYNKYNNFQIISIDLSNSDFSNVKDISSMFRSCLNLIYINLKNINLSSVENMENLFNGCESLVLIDLSNLYIPKILNISSMFYDCIYLTYINFTNITISSVKDISYMFYNCQSLDSIDLSHLDISQVTNIKSMFDWCINLKFINLKNNNISSIENMNNLFHYCKSLESIDLSNLNFSNVKDMSSVFSNTTNLKFINLTNINISPVKNISYLFYGCQSLESIDLSHLDISNAIDMLGMFRDCKYLKYINVRNINIFSVIDISYLFYGCKSLESIDLSNSQLSNIKYMSSMFSNCIKLKYINLTNVQLYSVEDISNLFDSCSKLISIDLSVFEKSNINNMEGTFSNCDSLEIINFGNINTSFVRNMSSLFYRCKSLTSVNLSNFDSSSVIDTSYMFFECSNLNYLDLTNFVTPKVMNASNMFNGCSSLLYLDFPNFNSKDLIDITKMFYGCESLIYLNLFSFNLMDSVKKNFLFFNVPSYTKYCIKNPSTELLLNINNNNCSHACFKKNRKLDIYNKTCTELCINNKILYEYNNMCYIKCPKRTFVNGPICEELNESMTKIPEGYYFDLSEQLFKKCYVSCKSCNYGGNHKNHNCIECKSNYIFFNDSTYKTNCYRKCEYYFFFDDLNNYYHCTEKNECPEKYNKVILDKKKCINDCKKDNTYKYEFNNQCLKSCPKDTYYNEDDKICYYYNNYMNTSDEEIKHINEDEIINTNLFINSSNDIPKTNEISIITCHENCKECTDYSSDYQNMKCISCKDGFNMIFGTQNCVDAKKFPNFFIYLDYLYPCSIFSFTCYECDPFLSKYIDNSCINCIPGYIFNEKSKRCETCKENEYPICVQNFDSCRDAYSLNCELYTTYCISLKNEKLEKICENNNFNSNETCVISNKYKIIFINWLKESSSNISYPSYNSNKNDYLLIELTLNFHKRKLLFYNENGRGLFDEINDKYEMNVQNRRAYSRTISSSIVIKANNSEEYRYLINFENYNNNLELIDIKTGKIFIDNLFSFLWMFDYIYLDLLEKPSTYLLELNEQNFFLLATFAKYRINNKIVLLYFIFSLEDSTNQEINIDSLNKIEENILSFDDLNFNIYARFHFIQTKSGNLYISFVSETNELYYYDIQENNKYFLYNLNNKMSFQKLLLIKDEIKFLSYFSNDNYLVFIIFETMNDSKDNIILEFKFKKYLPYRDNNDNVDIIFLSELKVIFVLEQANIITLFILNFFNDYKNFVKNEYLINIYGKGINNSKIYSLIFKYRNMLGLQFKNEEENGFILFGYYNSTDPKQILDVKKDGLFYNIYLENYLNIESNIFGYELKCIQIIEVPNPNTSGLYLLTNTTKNFIQKNDCIDINTKISLYFSYNGTLNKGNYFFKFVGVLQEPILEIVQKNSEETFWNFRDITLKKKYIEEYNRRRNMHITGRVALVQINVLNETKIFCDKKYDEFAIKSKEGKLIACGEGQFYDVENMNEITQLNLGKNYYFDKTKNYYIKCHEKCKTCSRKFNDTHMNCDICIENYFIRNDNCLAISECEYNYYYDKDLSLICINRAEHCPDFKPFENSTTKECIQNCNINEYNKECAPTNNIIAINDTIKNILNNIQYINLEEKLFINKTKYIIFGNNVTFIFSTSEIEKKELYNNYNTSSIILGESEKYIEQFYLINEVLPIPILKIEILNNHSNDMELYYELFNPLNFSQKLDLNLIQENYIEIRKPQYLKQYKIDLILKTRELGYNIFDLNDPFYNDICSAFSYNNTDFSLSERKNIIDLSDENLCPNDCNYSSFDIKTLRTICLCKIGFDENNKTSDLKNNDIQNENYKELVNLVKRNVGVSKSSNIRVVKCFSMIFRKNLFIEN